MRSPTKTAVHIFVLFAAYFLSGKAGLTLAFVHSNATAVWPPAAIALCAFLLWGRRVWPGVFAGAFLVNLTTQGTVWTSLAIATGNTMEPFVGCLLVERWAAGVRFYEKPRTIFLFILLAGILSPLISASVGVLSLTLGGFAEFRQFPIIWFTWWLGDMVSNLVFAPFLLVWHKPPSWNRERRRIIEGLILVAAVIFLSQFQFGGWSPTRVSRYPMAHFAFPLVIWSAFRFGFHGTTAAALALSVLATIGTRGGLGPFAITNANDGMLLLQAFMADVNVTGLLLASVLHQRGLWQKEIQKVNQSLEYRVHERTHDLEQANRALARSNEELEQFAYVAAHDLREPLRTMHSYIQLLWRRYSNQFDAEASEFFKFVLDGSQRLHDLIEGLLQFSRVARSSMPMELTDLGTVVDQVVHDLGPALAESKGSVTRSNLPTILGDSMLLRLLFQNLIENAIKFSGPNAPSIDISATETSDAWKLAVRDKGIGVDPAYFEKIFVIFQRLQDAEKVSGTGIGLAICKKIVQRHGGRIWLESTPRQGSTFFIEIPKSGR